MRTGAGGFRNVCEIALRNGADHFEVGVVEESSLLAEAEEAPNVNALVALDFGKLNDAGADDAGGIFDDDGLTGLIGGEEAIDMNPIVGPRTEFAIEQAANGNDRDLRLFIGWRSENGNIAQARDEEGC